MKNITQNINKAIITTIIILSTLLIGAPNNPENAYIIYAVIGIYTIIYNIIQIIKKQKIELSIIDIILLVLNLSIIIPLIARTQVSLSEEIYILIKSIAIINMYFIIKKETKDEKTKKYLTDIIIIGIFILCIIGIDEITYNNLEQFKNLIGYVKIEYDEIRVCSLFAYPNTMACVAGLGIFLSIGNLIKEKDKFTKIIYTIVIATMAITFILTYSRIAYIIFFTFLGIYGAILIKKYKVKVSKKVLIVIPIFLLTYLIIGLNLGTELKLTKNYQKIFYKIESNYDYKFIFNIETEARENEDIILKFTQKDKYFDNIIETKEEIGKFSGNKEINIKTEENTEIIYLNIELKNNAKITIKDTYINGKNTILKYKIMPTKIVDKMQSISLNNKSANERIVLVQDTLKLIKNNWIFGLGGNSWHTMQNKVQSYNYTVREIHCYLIQTFLDSGIFGFMACIVLIIYICKNLIVQIKQENIDMTHICYILGILFVFAHSMLDFNMSYFYVQLIVFTLIAINTESKKQISLKHSNLIYICIIIACIITTYINIIEISYKKEHGEGKNSISVIIPEMIEKYYSLIPYNNELKQNYIIIKYLNDDKEECIKTIEELMKNEKYLDSNITLSYINIYVQKTYNNEEKLENVLKYIAETEEFARYKPEMQIQRLTNLRNIIEICKENNVNEQIIEKYSQQLKKEIEQKEQYILNYEKSRYDKIEVEKYKKTLEKIK